MRGGGKRISEEVVREILTNEKRINASQVAPHQTVSLRGGQQFQRLKAGAVITRTVPSMRGIISHYPLQFGTVPRVILAYNHPRPKGGYVFPHPVIIPVDIN